MIHMRAYDENDNYKANLSYFVGEDEVDKEILSTFLKNNPNIETRYPKEYDELDIDIYSLNHTFKNKNI